MGLTFDWIWGVLLLPLAGFLLQAFFGKAIADRFGKRACGALAVIPIAASFVVALLLTVDLAGLAPDARLAISTWFDWIAIDTLRVPFELRVDTLSMTMALIITGVGALIHLYATGYMADEKEYSRFFTYMNLFIAFMLMLVLGNNLALVFIGWEGVGLCSYLLIGFWYNSIENAKAANKAFIVNRIGDWGMILGIFLIYCVFAGSTGILPEGENRFLSFDVILPVAERVLAGVGPVVVWCIPLLLFIGAMGKSAQFPLYLWLPDAMAGPTPVSALIHAATMVTSGIYLVSRCHIFFELAPVVMLVVAGVGTFTAFFAATIAFGQTDIKKVLAYSTVSQLGYMFLACGVGAFSSGMFHVTTHAFFKALLFLGSGAVIAAMAHEQDMRRYGNLKKYLPITFWTMMAGFIAICGIPPLAGFFSKDEILGRAYLSSHHWHEAGWLVDPQLFYWIGLITALMTAAYMTRMFWLTFYGGEERWRTAPAVETDHHAEHHEHAHADHGEDAHGFFYTDEQMAARVEEHGHHHALTPEFEPKEVGPAMTIPLVVLAILSIFGGVVLAGGAPLSTLFEMHIPHYFQEWLAPAAAPRMFTNEIFHGSHSTEWVLVGLSVGAAVLGIVWMALRYRKGLPNNEEEITGIRAAAGNQWFFDSSLYKLFVTVGGVFSNGIYRWFDKGLIDGVLVNGSAWFAGTMGKALRLTQSGYVRYYAVAMLIGVVALMSYIIWATGAIGAVR
ncbi:MAG: NADH-quinone oxidoreductase subunit L [Armatimonadota bacterium]|nr:NADH-quinone oxidoreductase subunit L [Armatimonadota bacterium]